MKITIAGSSKSRSSKFLGRCSRITRRVANGYTPLAMGSNVPTAVREFSWTLFSMRPDISLFVLHTVFNSNIRDVLGLKTVPCCIIQTRSRRFAHDVSLPSTDVGGDVLDKPFGQSKLDGGGEHGRPPATSHCTGTVSSGAPASPFAVIGAGIAVRLVEI